MVQLVKRQVDGSLVDGVARVELRLLNQIPEDFKDVLRGDIKDCIGLISIRNSLIVMP